MSGNSTFQKNEKSRLRSKIEHDITVQRDKRKKTIIEVKADIMNLAKDIRDITSDKTTTKQIAKLTKEIASDSIITNNYTNVERLYELFNESKAVINNIKQVDEISLERATLKEQLESLSKLIKSIENEYEKQKEREAQKAKELLAAKAKEDKLKEFRANAEVKAKEKEAKASEAESVYQTQLNIARQATIKKAEQAYEHIYERMQEAAKIFDIKTAQELEDQKKEINILIDEMTQFHKNFAKLDQFKDKFKENIEIYKNFIRDRTKELEKESIIKSLKANKNSLGRRLSDYKQETLNTAHLTSNVDTKNAIKQSIELENALIKEAQDLSAAKALEQQKTSKAAKEAINRLQEAKTAPLAITNTPHNPEIYQKTPTQSPNNNLDKLNLTIPEDLARELFKKEQAIASEVTNKAATLIQSNIRGKLAREQIKEAQYLSAAIKTEKQKTSKAAIEAINRLEASKTAPLSITNAPHNPEIYQKTPTQSPNNNLDKLNLTIPEDLARELFKKEQAIASEVTNKAATLIQAATRGASTRAQIKKENEAATLIQTSAKRMLERLPKEKISSIYKEEKDFLNENPLDNKESEKLSFTKDELPSIYPELNDILKDPMGETLNLNKAPSSITPHGEFIANASVKNKLPNQQYQQEVTAFNNEFGKQFESNIPENILSESQLKRLKAIQDELSNVLNARKEELERRDMPLNSPEYLEEKVAAKKAKGEREKQALEEHKINEADRKKQIAENLEMEAEDNAQQVPRKEKQEIQKDMKDLIFDLASKAVDRSENAREIKNFASSFALDSISNALDQLESAAKAKQEAENIRLANEDTKKSRPDFDSAAVATFENIAKSTVARQNQLKTDNKAPSNNDLTHHSGEESLAEKTARQLAANNRQAAEQLHAPSAEPTLSQKFTMDQRPTTKVRESITPDVRSSLVKETVLSGDIANNPYLKNDKKLQQAARILSTSGASVSDDKTPPSSPSPTSIAGRGRNSFRK